MIRPRIFLATLLLLATLAVPSLAQTPTVDEVAARVRDSAVTVYTWTEGGPFSPGRTGREPTGAGSGWVYADGVVVTNAHVVDGADRVEVVTAGGEAIPAAVAGTDWYHDVAVLRLDPDDGQALPPAAPVGDAGAVRPGDAVIAIGTPRGQFANTVSTGHVAATGIALNTGAGYSVTDLIRHDATLAPGNSGGPLVSMDGEVIGMNVASADIPGADDGSARIGFAIESDTVVASVEEILATGTVAYPYLGIETRAGQGGATTVASVEARSPAAEAGIQPGDALLAVDGERVDGAHPFIDLLYLHEVGETVTLTIGRDGDERQVVVTLGERPGDG
jgi:S1-C subfamily serine protease